MYTTNQKFGVSKIFFIRKDIKLIKSDSKDNVTDFYFK